MPESNDPKPIAEVIATEMKILIDQFPWHQEQIEAYAEGIVQQINKTLKASSERDAQSNLTEICSQLDLFEKNNLGGLKPKVQRYVTMLRGLIRNQILKGEVRLLPISSKPRKKAGSIELALPFTEGEN